jgi:hypothetical protein
MSQSPRHGAVVTEMNGQAFVTRPLQNLAICWKLRVSDRYSPYLGGMRSDNLVGADNQQERPLREANASRRLHVRGGNPQRPYARRSEAGAMRWSDLRGDAESWAEAKRPSRSAAKAER